MTESINNFHGRLINKIMVAASQEEVRILIDTAIAYLEESKINGYLIVQFINEATKELEQFNPIKETAQGWSNIKMALIHFRKVMQKFETASYYKN